MRSQTGRRHRYIRNLTCPTADTGKLNRENRHTFECTHKQKADSEAQNEDDRPRQVGVIHDTFVDTS